MKIEFTGDAPKGIEALKFAVRFVGGQSEMGRRLGVSQNTIGYWLKKDRKTPPAEHCFGIEDATGGVVTKNMLRPDLWP